MLKRYPSLTEQVQSHLRQRIKDAEFAAGRIPSEAELASEMKVSRATVRDALSRLETSGLIVRRQGAGTFVNHSGKLADKLVKTRLEQVIPYQELIREHGYTPSIQLLSVEERPAEQSLASQLNLEKGALVLAVQKLFRADKQPVIATSTYIPVCPIKNRYRREDLLLPVYEFLAKFCEQEANYFSTEIVPLIATAQLAATLELPKRQTALMAFEEVVFDTEHQPLARACSYFRDDLLRLRLIRRPLR